jgi:hypothetical protein
VISASEEILDCNGLILYVAIFAVLVSKSGRGMLVVLAEVRWTSLVEVCASA